MRRMFRCALIVAALFGALTSLPASGFAADLTEADLLNAATDLGHRYDANYAAKDPDAMAALYAPDGVLVSPSGPIVRGRDGLKAYYVKRFATGARSHRIAVIEVHLQGNGGYGIASFSVMVPDAGGRLHEERGTIVALYSRDPDGWHLRLVEPSVPPQK